MRRSLHTVTFLYADLRGFTPFIEVHGDAAGAELVREYRRLVRAEIADSGGREFKTEGDSFLVEFLTARQALECATGMLERAERWTRDRPELPLRLGVGLHAGEPEADYIGAAVNVAARLGQAAEGGELLASDVVGGLLRTSGVPSAHERAGLALKGIADPPRVYAFDWRSRADPEGASDGQPPPS
jgi:class 3 adenylate cyclase